MDDLNLFCRSDYHITQWWIMYFIATFIQFKTTQIDPGGCCIIYIIVSPKTSSIFVSNFEETNSVSAALRWIIPMHELHAAMESSLLTLEINVSSYLLTFSFHLFIKLDIKADFMDLPQITELSSHIFLYAVNLYLWQCFWLTQFADEDHYISAWKYCST